MTSPAKPLRWPCAPLPCIGGCSVQEWPERVVFWCGRHKRRVVVGARQLAMPLEGKIA